jgi:hypothetical protein
LQSFEVNMAHCVRLAAAAATLMGLALPAASEGTPETPQVVVENQGNVTLIKTGGTGWAGVIEAIQKLRALPADKDAQLIDVLQKNMDTLPPAYIYELARRTCASDPDRAIYLFDLAGARARYDAFRCVDETAQEGIAATIMSLPMPECKALADMSKTVAALKTLRASTEPFSSMAPPWWICSHGMAAVMAGLSNKTLAMSEWEKPQSEWAGIKRDIVEQMDYTVKKHSGE